MPALANFLSSAGNFFDSLANLRFGSLFLGLACFSLYILLRSRALFHALRAAYPTEGIRWRQVWGAYQAGFSINQIVPLGGGTVAQLFLTKSSIPDSSYPAVGAGIWTGFVFDYIANALVMIFAFTQGVFPSLPDLSKVPAFDLAFFAGNPRFTLFLLTFLGCAVLVGFALLSARVRAFWARVRQGLTILRDRRRWAREMASWQAASWLARLAAYWFLLDAFHIGGSLRNALLVLGVQVVASLLPFTPGGAGVQQALLVTVFASSTDASTVAAFSVGQQIAIAAWSALIGFVALATIFNVRSFKEVIRRGKEARAAAKAGPPAPAAET